MEYDLSKKVTTKYKVNKEKGTVICIITTVDEIPRRLEKYDLATVSKAAKIRDSRVRQIYVREDLFSLGIVEKEIDGSTVRIYDRERMLIELLRNKNTMPYDLYKEIIMNYREIINDLEIWRIQEYASIFPKSKMISKALDEEVM